MLCFDVSSADSLENVSSWLEQIRNNSKESIKVLIVATKIDVPEAEKQVNGEKATTMFNN